MSYSAVEDCTRWLLSGSIDLRQAINFVRNIKDRKFVIRNFIEILEITEHWRNSRKGHFSPLKNRPLVFSRIGDKTEASQVHVSGLWISPEGPAILWLFFRKFEALMQETEFGFACSAMRKVFPERELRKLPIFILDMSAGQSGRREITQFHSDTLPKFSTQQMDQVFGRYLKSRESIEPTLEMMRKERKPKHDPRQTTLF